MWKKYNGHYEKLEESVESKSREWLERHLRDIIGKNDFIDYETAWIMEYNWIGRNSAQYYFSMKDKKWHKLKIGIEQMDSWASAIEPFRTVVWWILTKLGYKAKQEKQLRKWFKESTIN